MAYKQSISPALIVIVEALLLLAVATPLAYGQMVNVEGRVCCTSNGNCPPGSVGVQGVPVNLNCITSPNGQVNSNQGTTDEAGQFTIRSNTTINLYAPLSLTKPIPCVASVKLPLNSTNCRRLNENTGTLIGMPPPLNTDEYDINSAPLPNITVNIEFMGPINLGP